MMSSIVISAVVFLFTSVLGIHSLTYSDLEALGVSCSQRDKCEGYANNLTYMDRSCECDFNCSYYKDCCIDTYRRRNTGRITNMRCLNYGVHQHSGVYAISTCSRYWSGPAQIRQKCTGPIDYSDPLVAAPVTSNSPGSQAVTYRNLFCAECNNADMDSLISFQLRMSCEGLQETLTQEQIFADLVYNAEFQTWGLNRLNSFGNATNFVGCEIIFDVPDYLNNSVRFCRSNIISRCAPGWTRQLIKKHCEDYMAVVYDNNDAYRNPHCAICNYRTVNEITCMIGISSRKRPMSFALLLDVNQSDGDQVGMRRVATPECPSAYKYDPFFKRCRELVCALPGHTLNVSEGKCVRSG